MRESAMSRGTCCRLRRTLMERAQRMDAGRPREPRLLLPLAADEEEASPPLTPNGDTAVLLAGARERKPPGTTVHTVKSEPSWLSPRKSRLVVFSAKFT